MLSDFCACHFSTRWLAEEVAEFITDECWFGETAWCSLDAISRSGSLALALLLAVSFSHVSLDILLECLEV